MLMAETNNPSGESEGSNQRMTDQVTKVFNKFDTNGDGKISMTDLGLILDKLGSKTSQDDLQRIMNEIDEDGDGFIDLKEFQTFYLSGGEKDSNDEELRNAFNLYDKDKNGKICVKELHSVMKSLGEKCSVSDCRRMISSVDVDGDGCVDFEEFKKMMAI